MINAQNLDLCFCDELCKRIMSVDFELVIVYNQVFYFLLMHIVPEDGHSTRLVKLCLSEIDLRETFLRLRKAANAIVTEWIIRQI